MKYRKKPVEIHAVQFDPRGIWPACIVSWDKESYRPRDTSWGYIETLEGKKHVMAGDWIIKGVQGEFYPCKPDIFLETYEPVDINQ